MMFVFIISAHLSGHCSASHWQTQAHWKSKEIAKAVCSARQENQGECLRSKAYGDQSCDTPQDLLHEASSDYTR